MKPNGNLKAEFLLVIAASTRDSTTLLSRVGSVVFSLHDTLTPFAN